MDVFEVWNWQMIDKSEQYPTLVVGECIIIGRYSIWNNSIIIYTNVESFHIFHQQGSIFFTFLTSNYLVRWGKFSLWRFYMGKFSIRENPWCHFLVSNANAENWHTPPSSSVKNKCKTFFDVCFEVRDVTWLDQICCRSSESLNITSVKNRDNLNIIIVVYWWLFFLLYIVLFEFKEHLKIYTKTQYMLFSLFFQTSYVIIFPLLTFRCFSMDHFTSEH